MNTTTTSRKVLTSEECKKILFNLGIKFGVPPRLISERLLSDLDKVDMMVAGIDKNALEAHVRAWIESGMPDYANGKDTPLRFELLKWNRV